MGSAPAAAEAAARAARAADRAYAASLTAKDAAGQTRAQIAEEDAAFAAHLAVVPPPHIDGRRSRTPQKRGTRCATGPSRNPPGTPSC